jgi:ribosomal protein S18 acetylase RimI-like enzyme
MAGKITWKKPYENIKKAAEIDDAYIEEKYQNRGIGKLLLEKLEQYFKETGADMVFLLVDSLNFIGNNAWKKYGFEDYQLKMKKKIDL